MSAKSSFVHRTLSKLDLFARNPTWLINGNLKQTTYAGQIFTLSVIGFLAYQFITLFIQLLQRQNPQVIQYTQAASTFSDNFEVSPTGFQYMMSVTYNGNFVQQESNIFNVEADIAANDGSWHNIEIVPCIPSQFDTSQVGYGAGYCVQVPQTLNGPNSAIHFYLYKCINSTANGNMCQNENTINDYILNSKVYIYFQQYSMVPTDYRNPIQFTTWYYYANLGLSGDWLKKAFFSIGRVDMTTDDGIIFDSLHSQSEMIQDGYGTDVMPIGSDGNFFRMSIFISGNALKITRLYMKITDVLAKINGLSATVILILALFLLQYARLKTYEHLSKETLLFCQVCKTSSEQDGSLAKVHLEGNPDQQHEHVHNENDEFSSRVEQLTFMDWVRSLYKKKSPKMEYLEKVVREIDSNLDMGTMLRRMGQLTLLKNIILTDDERVLFDNIQNPACDMKLDKEILEILNRPYEDNTDKVMQALKNLTNGGRSRREILMQLYGPAIKEIPHEPEQEPQFENEPFKENIDISYTGPIEFPDLPNKPENYLTQQQFLSNNNNHDSIIFFDPLLC